ADENSRPDAARRINRSVRHRNPDEMYEREYKADSDAGEANGRSQVSGAKYGKNQKERQHDFYQEGRKKIVMTRGVFAVTISGQTCHARVIARRCTFNND